MLHIIIIVIIIITNRLSANCTAKTRYNTISLYKAPAVEVV